MPFQTPGQPQRLQRLLQKLLFYYLQLYKELNKAVDECHLVVDLRALLREKKMKIIKQLYFYVLIEFLWALLALFVESVSCELITDLKLGWTVLVEDGDRK